MKSNLIDMEQAKQSTRDEKSYQDLIIATEPLVSVIIPAYNAGKFLHLSVESVRQQSYPNWEIVIVDDGSGDNTLQVAMAYQESEPRIRVVSGPNQGVSQARQNGLNASRGEWVYFLDADDLLHEYTLERLLQRPTNASIVFGATVYARSRSEVISRQSVTIGGLGVASLYPLLFSFRMPQAIWGKLIRRDIALQIEWPDRTIKIGEDALSFFSILPLCQRIYAVPYDTYYYIQHEDSVMARKSPEAVASMRIYLRRIRRMVSHLSPELRLLGYRYVLMEYYAYLIYGGEWVGSFAGSCLPHAKLPLKAGLLLETYKRSIWLGDRLRNILRTAGASKKIVKAKLNSLIGWISAL